MLQKLYILSWILQVDCSWIFVSRLCCNLRSFIATLGFSLWGYARLNFLFSFLRYFLGINVSITLFVVWLSPITLNLCCFLTLNLHCSFVWKPFWYFVINLLWCFVWNLFWYFFLKPFWYFVWNLFWYFFWNLFWCFVWNLFWYFFWNLFWCFIWNLFWYFFWNLLWCFVRNLFWYFVRNLFWYFVRNLFWYFVWNLCWNFNSMLICRLKLLPLSPLLLTLNRYKRFIINHFPRYNWFIQLQLSWYFRLLINCLNNLFHALISELYLLMALRFDM